MTPQFKSITIKKKLILSYLRYCKRAPLWLQIQSFIFWGAAPVRSPSNFIHPKAVEAGEKKFTKSHHRLDGRRGSKYPTSIININDFSLLVYRLTGNRFTYYYVITKLNRYIITAIGLHSTINIFYSG